MSKKTKKDFETISLFLILGLLTLALVLILRVVLFGPGTPVLLEMGMRP